MDMHSSHCEKVDKDLLSCDVCSKGYHTDHCTFYFGFSFFFSGNFLSWVTSVVINVFPRHLTVPLSADVMESIVNQGSLFRSDLTNLGWRMHMKYNQNYHLVAL